MVIHRTWNLFLWTLLLVNTHIIGAQDALTVAGEDAKSAGTLPTDKEDLTVAKGPVKKDKPAVIVVADKVDNPPNWNSWTPVAPPPNATSWAPPYSNPLQSSLYSRSHYVKGDKRTKKPSGLDKWRTEDLPSKVVGYGKMLFHNFMEGMDKGAGRDGHDGHGSSGYHGHEGHFEGPPPEGRGLVNWISRLIGVDGKSLGEFLREYQVHVLYDLVFTFFKWIFFLYVGLIIP